MNQGLKHPGLAAAMAVAIGIGAPVIGHAESLSWLKTRGPEVVNEKGEPVLLQGVGLGNWLLPEGYMWRFGEKGDRPRKIEKLVADLIGPEKGATFWTEFRKSYITEKDIERIAALGFNSVRPALNARLFLSEGENAEYQTEGFELLDNLVGWCRTHGVYVILDMHAAPGGQTGQNIDDSADDLPQLFMKKENEQRLVDLWVKIVQRYKDDPTIAAYDLLNEPLPQRTGAEEKHKAQLEPLYKRVTAAIRAVDKRHMITLEGADWANDWSVFGPPFDGNVLYQFHYYAWDRPDNVKGIGNYLAQRKRLNAPIWVGETGEKDNAIYWASLELFEANNVGWSFWPWKKMETRNTPFSIKPPAGWKEIAAYSRGEGKPTPELAQKAFDQLLQNIRLENCDYFPDVVNAIFRRVPGRIEAENYGQEGMNKSWSVKTPTNKSKAYRKSEPVPVESIGGDTNSRRGEQAIHLNTGEWTAYNVNSREARSYSASARVKASGPGGIRISIAGQDQTIEVSAKDWQNVELKPIKLELGKNRLQFAVERGSVEFDWIELR
jgi:endoglucanase